MPILYRLIILSFSALFSVQAKIKDDNVQSASISKWEYCEGCKETVNLYARKIAARLRAMHDSGLQVNSPLEAADLVEGICDDTHLLKYRDFMKFSCMKIMDEHRAKFLKRFEGKSSGSTPLQKADLYQKKKAVKFDLINQFCL